MTQYEFAIQLLAKRLNGVDASLTTSIALPCASNRSYVRRPVLCPHRYNATTRILAAILTGGPLLSSGALSDDA